MVGNKKKSLVIERVNDDIKIYSYPYKDAPRRKKLIKVFEYDENVKQISNFDKQVKANEKAILNYYKNKSKEKYVPTSQNEYEEQLKTIKRADIDREKYFSHSRILFTKKKQRIIYDYMYVIVKVKIYLDGYTTYSKGRSDYYYTEEIQGENKVYPAFRKGIPREKLDYAIRQAAMRAIAPFGSNVKFDILEWYYAYHQQDHLY